MEEPREKLSAAQKRDLRYQGLMAPQGVTFTSPQAKTRYQERARRIISAYRVEEPDRVPVSLSVAATPAFLAGTDLHTVMYDYNLLFETWRRFNAEFDMDTGVMPGSGVLPGRVYDLLDYKLYHWPGHGLPLQASGAQYVEGEYMRPDEYDLLIRNPSDFWMRVYLPRTFGAFESWKSLQPLTNIIELPAGHFMPYINPAVQASLQRLIAIGNELAIWGKYNTDFTRSTLESGMPLLVTGQAKAPFDTIGDTLRGTKGIIQDMYRQPEKLLEAIDVVTQFTIDQTLEAARGSGMLRVMFPLHKGADGFMSQKQFERFYWPSLKKVLDALIAEGLLPLLFAEGSFDSRLESVNEFARGETAWLFDRTDMARAKKILGARCCIAGNVPTSLLLTGTPESVKQHCRQLIQDCAPGGGYILSGGASFDQGNRENLQALIDAAQEYGIY